MLITKFAFHNLYSFDNFTVDLTYPKKLRFSTIENEYLSFATNFKIKKVCLISGSNATGKTAVGRLLCAAMNFIVGRNNALDYIKIRNSQKKATIVLEFVTPFNKMLHEVVLDFRESSQSGSGVLTELNAIAYRSVFINSKDSQHTARNRLDSLDYYENSLQINPEVDLFKNLHSRVFSTYEDDYQPQINDFFWKYVFYETIDKDNSSNVKEFSKFDLKRATNILKAFDPTITSIVALVNKVKAAKSKKLSEPQVYQIQFENGNSVPILLDNLNDSAASNIYKRLSKGTFEALSIIDFVERIIRDKLNNSSSTLFLDERMAHVHTQLETSMLNVMIQKLGVNSQFFYSTHNTDLLEMNLPIHSHLFLKRNANQLVEAVQPEYLFKKNDRSLLNYVKNDVFGTCPDTNLIDEMLYEE